MHSGGLIGKTTTNLLLKVSRFWDSQVNDFLLLEDSFIVNFQFSHYRIDAKVY